MTKSRAIGYWICTVLIAFVFLSGGVEVLGGGAILVPRLPLVKEWAYAGMIFDLTGATASHIATGDDLRHILVPLVSAALVVASWALRPESRKLREVLAA